MTNEELQRLKKIYEEATPLEKWEGSSNYPFYAQIKKPAPSLSKHEGTPRGENLWRYQDGVYMLTAVHEFPKLLTEIETLKESLFQIMRTGTTLQGNTVEATIAYETLGKLGYFNE